MNPTSIDPTPSSGFSRGRILLLVALVAAPALANLLAWPFKGAVDAVAPVMLFASVPLSLAAGIVAGTGLPGSRAMLLVWIPLGAVLCLAVSVGLQGATCAINEPHLNIH